MFGKTKDPAKAARKEAKAAAKRADSKADKADSKAKKADKAAAKNAPKGVIGTLTDPKTARRAVAVAKIAGPAVAPVALRAATTVRGYLDERRAGRLGVPVDDVAAYRGPTGAAQARIATLAAAVADLQRRRSSDLQVTRFADVARTRLEDLRAATRAAASMPTGRRRVTLSAIGRDLNQIDADLMTFLVGHAA